MQQNSEVTSQKRLNGIKLKILIVLVLRCHPIRNKKVQCALPTTATVSSLTIKQIVQIVRSRYLL